MTSEDRILLTDIVAEMRELKGELREFKLHTLDRIKRLEGNERRHWQTVLTVVSVIIAAGALFFSCITEYYH
jgi:hypothetical protein